MKFKIKDYKNAQAFVMNGSQRTQATFYYSGLPKKAVRKAANKYCKELNDSLKTTNK